MKIELTGIGSILTEPLSACALIDDKILIDAPNGVTKKLRGSDFDFTKFESCIITHFHGDHYFDLPFLLLSVGLRQVREKPFYIIGPSGIHERTKSLYHHAYPDNWDRVTTNANLQFIEIPDLPDMTWEHDDKLIKFFQVDHVGLESYGMLISGNGRKVLYSGDTILCDSLIDHMKLADLAILDFSFMKSKSGHMGEQEVKQVCQMFPDCTSIANHMSDEVQSKSFDWIQIPREGDVFHV